MAQLLLFDVAVVCCLNCGEAIADLCDLRRNCSKKDGNHEVTRSQYFVLYRKSNNPASNIA